jgi:hypothetical protein
MSDSGHFSYILVGFENILNGFVLKPRKKAPACFPNASKMLFMQAKQCEATTLSTTFPLS